MDKFEKDLKALINSHSRENESNTPDHILAKYMRGCLESFNLAVKSRELFHGRELRQDATIKIESKT